MNKEILSNGTLFIYYNENTNFTVKGNGHIIFVSIGYFYWMNKRLRKA